MPRKRNQLIAAFPPGTLDSAAASEALRKAGGDLENARLAIMAEHAAAASSGAKKDDRVAPRHSVPIHNLSDRKYCCVWSVEEYADGYRPDVARTLLATVARHVNPILRDRGWRVKRLIESESKKWIGLCTGNGRADADAASVNIQLNLRVEPSRHCRQFRPFRSILAVMLHEITHTSIGLEDIHPPAFYELLDEIKAQYREKLEAGEVDAEPDEYGTTEHGTFVSGDGTVGSAAQSASDVLGAGGADSLDVLGSAGTENECGASTKRRRGRGKRRGGSGSHSKGFTSNAPPNEKKRPLLKGAKMVDKRTKVGKAAMRERENATPRELAARAALARFGGGDGGGSGGIDSNGGSSVGQGIGRAAGGKNSQGNASGKPGDEICIDDSSSDEEDANDTAQAVGTRKDDKKYDSSVESEDGDGGGAEEDDGIVDHEQSCGCRSCHWGNMFFLSEDEEGNGDE